MEETGLSDPSLFFLLNTKFRMKKRCYIFFQCLLLVLLLPFSFSCDDDLQNEFSRQRAFFRYPMVNNTPELRAALNSPGMFCKITFPPKYYLFSDAYGHATQMNRTALEAYGKPIFISGFVVGTPSIPDMGGNFFTVAYDLVCPTCYSESFISKTLDFNNKLGTEMKCNKCGRVYDLNNDGIIKSGGEGQRMFRYRMTYSFAQGMLVIQN